VHANLEVEVRPGRVTRRADAAENGAPGDLVADSYVDRFEVRVERPDARRVPDDDEQPPTAGLPGRPRHQTGAGGRDLGPRRRKQIDAGVEPAAAATELVADWCEQRPGERDRSARRTAVQRGSRCPSDDPVGHEPDAPLEPCHRRGNSRPEASVDRARREAVPRQRQLEHADRTAVRAALQRRVGARGREPGDGECNEQQSETLGDHGTIRSGSIRYNETTGSSRSG